MLNILNLGAGVQSTTIYLMVMEGLLPKLDYAVFADTQEEPEAVYRHLEWLCELKGPPILIRTAGKLGDDLMKGRNSTGGRFASIPAYTAPDHTKRTVLSGCSHGMTRRQCTKEYKVDVVERTIRRDILGLAPRRRTPRNTVVQWFGISLDEERRADRIKERLFRHWSKPYFPLIEKRMRREDCKEWLKDRVPHEVPRSACVFCPYKSWSEWKALKENTNDWNRAVEVDRALRIPGNVVNRHLDQSLYLTSKCIPLEMVDIDAEVEREQLKRKNNFPLLEIMACEGMCGR